MPDFSKIAPSPEQIELIGRFFGGLFAPALKTDDPFILFVGQLQDVDLPTFGQSRLHPLAIGLHLRMAGAKAHVHAQLRTAKTHVQQAESELICSRTLGRRDHRQVKHHQHPHQAVTAEHGDSFIPIGLMAQRHPRQGQVQSLALTQ